MNLIVNVVAEQVKVVGSKLESEKYQLRRQTFNQSWNGLIVSFLSNPLFSLPLYQKNIMNKQQTLYGTIFASYSPTLLPPLTTLSPSPKALVTDKLESH